MNNTNIPFAVGETLNYTGVLGVLSAEFRGFHTDYNTGEKVARIIVRPDNQSPFECSVTLAELSRSVVRDAELERKIDYAVAVATKYKVSQFVINVDGQTYSVSNQSTVGFGEVCVATVSSTGHVSRH